MAKNNHIYPSKEAVYKMYKFLSEFEQAIAKCAGEFDFDSPELKQFLQNQDIYIHPVSKTKSVRDLPRKNYIVFTYGDRRADYDDKVHDLLRHIRNAIGHALITKTAVNRNCFKLTDKNKVHSVTMCGNIEENLFFALLEQLKKTKK